MPLCYGIHLTSNMRTARQPVGISRSLIQWRFTPCSNTRIAKLDAPDSPFDAIILARAGMVRLGWGPRITRDLGPPTILYAVSQGALAIEIRADDDAARALCASIAHWPTEWSCYAERACLRLLEGGCSVPVGVHSELREREGARGSELELTGCVTSLDGKKHVEHTLKREVSSLGEAEALGKDLANVLMERGAREILDDIKEDREKKIKLSQAAEATAA